MSASSSAGATPPAIFTQTKRLRDAVTLINGVQPKRVPLLLTRILTHLKEQTAAVFNADELAQLCELFALSPDEVHTILDALSYIYEQAAYHLLSADKLKVQLSDVLQVAEPQGAAIAFVWGEQREAYMNNLRERSFGTPQVLSSVHYRSQVTMGTDDLSKRKDIHTILSLGLTTAGVDPESASPAPLCVELSTAGLQSLYDSLEKIQSQLDALSDKPA